MLIFLEFCLHVFYIYYKHLVKQKFDGMEDQLSQKQE